MRHHRGLTTRRDRRIAALLSKDNGVTARLVDQAFSGFSGRYNMTYEEAVALCPVESNRSVENIIRTARPTVGYNRARILISKLNRLEAKEIAAFCRVLKTTGHPTTEDLIGALQNEVDLLRPRFDEEVGGDLYINIQRLFREVYGREIDVKAEIIRPALTRLRKLYQPLVNRENSPRRASCGMFSLMVARTFSWFVGREAIPAFFLPGSPPTRFALARFLDGWRVEFKLLRKS